MAIETLKSAGIKAYQGSSQKPAVVAAQPAAQPEMSATVKSVKTAEKAVEVVRMKPEKKPETKPGAKKVEIAADKGGNSRRVQEKPSVKEIVKMPEPVLPENKEATEGTLPNESLKRAVEEINKNAVNSEAVFGVHESTNRVTIKIVDKKTKEVLKEYPPEKTLDMIAKVWELAGLLVDEKG